MSDNQAQATANETETAAVPETVAGRKIVAKQGKETILESLFKFRKVKDKETGVETQRDSILLHVPTLSIEGLVDILENGDTRPKELELVLSALADVVLGNIKDALSDDSALTAENFPIAKYSFAEIANAPESERASRGLDKELVVEFAKDYIEVMPAATGKDIKVVERQAAVMLQRFNPIRNHAQKDVIIKGFLESLDVYTGATNDLETFAPVVEYFQKRLKALSEQEVSMTDALGF